MSRERHNMRWRQHCFFFNSHLQLNLCVASWHSMDTSAHFCCSCSDSSMLLGLEWTRRIAHVFARLRDCEEVRLEYKPHRAILIMWKRTMVPSKRRRSGLILLMSQNTGTMLVSVTRNACLMRLVATCTTYRSKSAWNDPKYTLPVPYRKSVDKTTRT